MAMQHMTPAPTTTDFIAVDAPRGGAIYGFMFVLAFYAVLGLAIAGFVAA